LEEYFLRGTLGLISSKPTGFGGDQTLTPLQLQEEVPRRWLVAGSDCAMPMAAGIVAAKQILEVGCLQCTLRGSKQPVPHGAHFLASFFLLPD
jgi:hypothetical protein